LEEKKSTSEEEKPKNEQNLHAYVDEVHGTGKKDQALSNIGHICNTCGAPSSWDSIDYSFRSEKPKVNKNRTLIEDATLEDEEE